MTPVIRQPADLYGAATDAAQSPIAASRTPGLAQGAPMARLATELAEAWLRAAQRLATFYGRGDAAGHG